jgi:hypothetical protein
MPLQGESRHCKFEHFEFWAERGMITLVDTTAAQDSSKHVDEYTWRIPPGQFMARAIAAMVQEPDKYADKLRRLRLLVTDAAEVCKIAKTFGDPTDPSVLEHVIKHQRKNSIVMPHELPDIHIPGLPEAKYKLSGTTVSADILTKGYRVTPDLLATPGDQAAVRNAGFPGARRQRASRS